jgi:hypothetical protein
MIAFCKTPAAARELGVTYHRLMGLVRFAKINPPGRDGSGHYIWGRSDLKRARRALEAAGRGKGVEV